MRDPDRIKPFMNELCKLWKKYPDYRFGQLIYMVVGKMQCGDIFFPEDDKWIAAIENLME